MKYIKVDNVIHPVQHMDTVGFYVDIEGEATTKPTKEKLLEELKKRYASVVGLPCTSPENQDG